MSRHLRYPYGVVHRRDRAALIAAAGGPICSQCGRTHPKVNLAHLCHNPWCRLLGHRSLLCPTCHTKHDAGRRIAVKRRKWALEHRQEWTDREIEYATIPVTDWPRDLREPSLLDLSVS